MISSAIVSAIKETHLCRIITLILILQIFIIIVIIIINCSNQQLLDHYFII